MYFQTTHFFRPGKRNNVNSWLVTRHDNATQFAALMSLDVPVLEKCEIELILYFILILALAYVNASDKTTISNHMNLRR